MWIAPFAPLPSQKSHAWRIIRARAVVRKETAHLLLGDDRLNDSREGKAEDQRPQDLPSHGERHVGACNAASKMLVAMTSSPLLTITGLASSPFHAEVGAGWKVAVQSATWS